METLPQYKTGELMTLWQGLHPALLGLEHTELLDHDSGASWLYTNWAPGHPVNINDNKYVAIGDGGDFGI